MDETTQIKLREKYLGPPRAPGNMKRHRVSNPGDHLGKQKKRKKLTSAERIKYGILPPRKMVMVVINGKARMRDIDST